MGMQSRPCNKPKRDMCKSIRDQMLSIRLRHPWQTLRFSLRRLANALTFSIPSIREWHSTAKPPRTFLDPVLVFPFLSSIQVLRI